jgi:hypothetical protein
MRRLKSALKSVLTAARRAALWQAIYTKRVQIHSRQACMEHVRCPLTLGRMTVALHHDRCELSRLQDAYNATLPIERRVFWGLA